MDLIPSKFEPTVPLHDYVPYRRRYRYWDSNISGSRQWLAYQGMMQRTQHTGSTIPAVQHIGWCFLLHCQEVWQAAAQRKRGVVDTDSDDPVEGKDNDNDAMEVQRGENTVGDKKVNTSVKFAGCSTHITEASSKCKSACCQKQFFSNPTCVSMLVIHEPLCMEAAAVAKKYKKKVKRLLRQMSSKN